MRGWSGVEVARRGLAFSAVAAGLCVAGAASAQTFTMTAVQPTQAACIGDDIEFDWRLFTIDGYNFPVSVSFSSLPSNIFALSILPGSVTPTPQGSRVLTQLIVGPGTLGPQTVTLRGIGANGQTRFANANVVRETIPGAPKPVTPEYGATTSTTPTFEWTGAQYAKTFRFQVALNDSFTPNEIIYEELIIDQPNPNALTVDTPLPANTTLYWRVQGENHCGSGFFSPVFPFFTGGMCAPLNLEIADGGTLLHEMPVGQTGNLGDLDLWLKSNHPRIGDLAISLEHNGTTVQLKAPHSCAMPGMSAHFDDRAVQPVGAACGAESPALSGGFKPQQALAAFNGQSMQGSWWLRVTDTNPDLQSGQLLGGCLQPKAAAISDVLFASGMEDALP